MDALSPYIQKQIKNNCIVSNFTGYKAYFWTLDLSYKKFYKQCWSSIDKRVKLPISATSMIPCQSKCRIIKLLLQYVNEKPLSINKELKYRAMKCKSKLMLLPVSRQFILLACSLQIYVVAYICKLLRSNIRCVP